MNFVLWVIGMTVAVLLLHGLLGFLERITLKKTEENGGTPESTSRKSLRRALRTSAPYTPIFVMLVAALWLINTSEAGGVGPLPAAILRTQADFELVALYGLSNIDAVKDEHSKRDDQREGYPELNEIGGCLRVTRTLWKSEWKVESDLVRQSYEEIGESTLTMEVKVDESRVDPSSGACSEQHRAKVQIEIGRFPVGEVVPIKIFADGTLLPKGEGPNSWSYEDENEKLSLNRWEVKKLEIRPQLTRPGDTAKIRVEYEHHRGPTGHASLYPNPRDYGELDLEGSSSEVTWPYLVGPWALCIVYEPDDTDPYDESSFYFHTARASSAPPEGVRYWFDDKTFHLVVDKYERRAFHLSYELQRARSSQHLPALAAYLRRSIELGSIEHSGS